MYVMVYTRLDITHTVGIVSRFLSNPDKKYWTAVKQILRYLRGTSRVCLSFGTDKPMLDGYRDADMVGDVDFRKFTSRFL